MKEKLTRQEAVSSYGDGFNQYLVSDYGALPEQGCNRLQSNYIRTITENILPLVLSIDDQKSIYIHISSGRLIGYYKRILHNEDTAFTELLKMCFEIDGIAGQLLL